MLKKLIGLGVVATFLAFSSAAYAGTCDDGTGNPDDTLCDADLVCDPDTLTCVDAGGGTPECTDDTDCAADEICDDTGTCVVDDTGGGGDVSCDDGTGVADDTLCAADEICDDATLTCVVDGGGGCSVAARSVNGSAGAGLLALALLGLVGMARRRNRR